MGATREAPDWASEHMEDRAGEPASWGRAVRADINLSAITGNVRTVRELVGSGCAVMAVVKANGYGLGAPWVAAAALEGGASWLAVACVDEGVQLRLAGYGGPLLVLSYVATDEVETALRNNLTLTLHRSHTARVLDRVATELGLPQGSVAVHIKVDTGLGRYGCSSEEFLGLLEEVSQLRSIRIQGLMTHFADADNPDLSFARQQLGRFNNLRREAARRGFKFEIVHTANSAAAVGLEESRLDMVRVGIMLSGNLPASHLSNRIALERALTLRTKLARVFPTQRGDTIGYGRTWTAPSGSLIGLVPVGYADGYSRALSNRAHVLVGGQRCPVVGRVSMDQAAIDITVASNACEGDEVVLIGSQGDDEITAADVASWAGTISYEILCGLTSRVPRHYFREGREVQVCNLLGCTPGRTAFQAEEEPHT